MKYLNDIDAPNIEMTDPITGQKSGVTEVIQNLAYYLFGNAIPAQYLDNLNLTAQVFDGKACSAQNFDEQAKKELGVS